MKKLFLFLALPSLLWADVSITNPRTAILPLPTGDASYLQNTASLQSGATFYVSSGTVDQSMIINGTNRTGSSQVFGVKGSSLTVLANGNVGIGVVNPGALLDVGGGGSVSNGNLFHVGGPVTVGPSYAVYDSAPGITATTNGSAFVFQLAGNINPTASGTHPLFAFMQVSPAMTTDVGATITNVVMIDVASLTAYAHVTNAYGLRVVAPSGATNNYAAKFTGTTIHDGVSRLKAYTVATLPAGVQGDTAFCTDLLAPGFLVAIVGGGTVVGPVFYNGSSWVAF